MTTIVDYREVEVKDRHIDWRGILTATLLAGAISLTVWEIWAKVITPFWAGGALSPIGLVKSALGITKDSVDPLLNAKAGAVSNALANGIHLLTGLIAYPLAYILGARPIANLVADFLPREFVGFATHWFTIGTVYGVILWVFALYIMAHLFAGFPPFLGFSNLGWASLVGHVLVGLAIAGTVHARD